MSSVQSPQAAQQPAVATSASSIAASSHPQPFTSPMSGSANAVGLVGPQSPVHLTPSHPDLQLPTPSPSARSQQAILSPGPRSPTSEPLSTMEAMLILTRGEQFTKYSYSPLLSVFGRTQEKIASVWYEKEAGSMGNLYWGKPGSRIKDESRCIPLAQITGLYEQAETDSFPKNLSEVERACCFSIVCGSKKGPNGELIKGRTLDLQADTVQVRDLWMRCIHELLVHGGFDVHERDAKTNQPLFPEFAGMQSPHSRPNSSRNSKSPSNAPQVNPAVSPAHVNWINSPAASVASPINSPAVAEALAKAQSTLHLQTSPTGLDQQQQREVAEQRAREMTKPDGEVHDDAGRLPSKEPDAVVYDDPLAASKMITSLSPTSNAELLLAHDPSREIPATLTVPASAEESAKIALSPSEHPTLTPMCSPIGQ